MKNVLKNVPKTNTLMEELLILVLTRFILLTGMTIGLPKSINSCRYREANSLDLAVV